MKVAIIGQGYVGLPAAHAAVHANHDVVGYVVNAAKVNQLLGGSSYVEDVPDIELAWMLNTRRYMPTIREENLAGFDVALVTVPTPLDGDRRPDLRYVESAARTLAWYVRRGCTIVLESTVAPGTTRNIFSEILNKANPLGLCHQNGDFFVGFSPERVDPCNPRWRFTNTPKLVSATTDRGLEVVCEFYETICGEVVPCSSTEVAETAKLLENTFRHVNIALVNELAQHCQRLGVSVVDVVNAAATKPYGFMKFMPGPGVGGHCLPIDPVYLSDKIASLTGRPFETVDLAVRVNNFQPEYVIKRVTEIMNWRRASVFESDVLVLGWSYKKNIADGRETPARDIVRRLLDLGARVRICDPHSLPDGDELRVEMPIVEIVPLDEVMNTAHGSDLVILVTDHDEFPYAELESMGVGTDVEILDTRYVMKASRTVHHL